MAKQPKSNSRRRARIADDDNIFVRSRTIASQDLADDKRDQASLLERQKEKRRQGHRRKLWAVFATIFALIVLVSLVMSQYVWRINNVSTDQTTSVAIDENRYADLANDYFAAHPASRFSFFMSQDNFSNHMVEVAPELHEARIIVWPFVGADLDLSFRQPVAVWETPAGSEYVDATGLIFSKNVLTNPGVFIKDESGLDIDGSAVASARFLNFVGQIIAGVDSSGVGQIESVSIPLGAIRYIELRLVDHPYAIKAQIDRDIDGQVADIVNTIRHLDNNNIVPGSYVDVRVDNKAYYK